MNPSWARNSKGQGQKVPMAGGPKGKKCGTSGFYIGSKLGVRYKRGTKDD